MLVKRGTLIDATIIEAQARRPQSEAGARSGTDPDAAWTKKGKRSHFGCRVHIGMDAGSGLVRGVEFTPANVADTDAADALIMGTRRRCTRTRRMSRKSAVSGCVRKA